MRLRQNDRLFTYDIFKCIFFNENVWISLKFIPEVWIKNIPALVQIMAWHWPGDKPLSEPMMVNLLTHICVARPQWVNKLWVEDGITTKFGGQGTFYYMWLLYRGKNNGKCNVTNWEYSRLICWLVVHFAGGTWIWTLVPQRGKKCLLFVWKTFCCAFVQSWLNDWYEWWKCSFSHFSPIKVMCQVIMTIGATHSNCFTWREDERNSEKIYTCLRNVCEWKYLLENQT